MTGFTQDVPLTAAQKAALEKTLVVWEQEETPATKSGNSPLSHPRPFANEETNFRNQLETYRCIWRGDKNPDNHETHLYSTCTSDPRFCPDGNCDSLEELAAEDLCPQDCTTSRH